MSAGSRFNVTIALLFGVMVVLLFLSHDSAHRLRIQQTLNQADRDVAAANAAADRAGRSAAEAIEAAKAARDTIPGSS
jgi:hypothetical protein